jgi:hypothetical protein
MKIWALVGLFSVATIPFAAAAETTEECQIDDTRRAVRERVDVPQAAPTTAAPTAAAVPRETAEAVTRAEPLRRRGGKRIPDAELIGPRGAL